MTTQMINGEEVYAINSFRVAIFITYTHMTLLCMFVIQVLNYGREYYSCSNLQGVLLENGRGNVR